MRRTARRALAPALAAVVALTLVAVPAPALPLGDAVVQAEPGVTPGYTGALGPPRAMTVGPDGLLWAAAGDGLLRRSAEGSITELTAGITGSSLADVVAGPDGNVWFTEFNPPGIIGRAAPDGTITEVAVFGVTPGFTSGNVQELLVGPDGNIWFSKPFNDGSGRIGRITPAGVVTEFTPPNPAAEPRDLVIGPDGRIWYTDSSDQGARLMAVTTDGTFTELLVEGAGWPQGAEPGPLVVGDEGDLWAGAWTGNGAAVVRITPSLDVTVVDDPLLVGNSIYSMAAVCGAVWVGYEAEQQGGALLRVAPDETITAFTQGVDANGLGAVAEGPDGDVWIADFFGVISSVGADVGAQAGCAAAPPTPTTTAPVATATTQPAARPAAVTATPRFTG